MPDNCEDITNNLSANPIEREQQIYNRILDLFRQFNTLKKDSTIWEGRTYIKLMDLLKQGDKNFTKAIWNAILLILVLFSVREDSIDSCGTDLKKLAQTEQKQIQMLLRDLFHPEYETKSM